MTQTKKTALSFFCIASLLGTSVNFTSFKASAAETGPVVINEVCAKNTVFAAPDGNFYDYIELYNTSSESVDLSGYKLSDNAEKPDKFVFPEGTVIGKGEHLLVYCNSKEFTLDGRLTAFFGLSTDGETITLTDKNGNTADTATFGLIEADMSYGRTSDGASDFAVMKMTPGEANDSGSVIKKVVQTPSFSVPSGFYDESFNIELSAEEGSKIYFTVDSSTPTTSSNEYTSAFSVEAALNKTQSERKPEDGGRPEERPREEGPGGKRPEEKEPAGQTGSKDAAVIRAVAYDSEGNASEVATAVYFIGYGNKASYYQKFKIVSLVTDSDNLFGREKGIWTNYEEEGREWERPANMQIFQGGTAYVDQNIGLRIHGGYTRRFNQKSFNVYARKDYGKSELEYDLFSGTLRSESTGKKIKDFDSFILRNAGNDWQDTRFRDKLNQALVSDRNFLEQAMEPCIVFINGTFYGHYEITEKLSEDYIHDHCGVKKSDVCIVKNQKLDEGDEATYQEYKELEEWIKSTDFSSSENYKKLCEFVDMDSFADYMSTEIYIANKDWGKNNSALWKTTTVDESNPYADGRWRFILFDTEFSSNIYNTVPANINLFEVLNKEENFVNTLLKAALKNPEFKQKFAITFMDIANYNFDTNKVNALISQYDSIYKEPVADTLKKFGGSGNYSNAVSTVKSWFGSRYSSAASHLKNAAGLKGSLVSVTVSNDSKCGTVKVNTLTPDFSSGKYTGKYYSDYPVTVSAVPAEGYTFAGWKLKDGTVIKSATAEIELGGETVVTAVYTTGNGESASTVTADTSGDVNADGAVNSKDLTAFMSVFYGKGGNASSADLNGDGRVNILDLIILKNKLIS